MDRLKEADRAFDAMSATARLGHAVPLLLLLTLSLLVAVSFVGAESLSFLDGQIRFYPAQREGDRILIPFTQPPAENEEVLLLYPLTDLFHLRRLRKETITPKDMTNPRPHYVYGLAEGRLSDPRTQFLVAVGKGITSLLRWQAVEAMNGDRSAGTCTEPDKGFAVTALQVLASEKLKATFYYLQEERLRSTIDTMVDEDKNSEISTKEIVGMVRPEGSCHVLAYNTSDVYGLHNTGAPEPVGPISGLIELSAGRSTERWLVLRSGRHEVWGYTFIELLPMPLNREPKRRFLLEDRA
jgi:hypothetical protein